ncbi:MAG TPA: ABC transporter substrate-binding protein [Dehalococcoidales bacterium]|nr:ABC transporter substrate-binding protein [Dehalococcoidales bacterium]
MRKKTLTVLSGLMCLVLVATLLGACTSTAEEPGTKAPLKIGMSTPSTGVAAEKGAPMGHANVDCIKYVNDELGGVDGHEIEALWLDNGYDASKAVTIVNRFVDEDCLLFTVASSGMMTAMMGIANENELSGFAAFSSPNLTQPPQHIYGQTPDYGDDWAAFAKYYLDNIWKGPGKPKMALHLLDNSTGAGARMAAEAGAEDMGIELRDKWIFEHPATTSSETTSLTTLPDDIDVLYISSTPAPTAIVIKSAVELGMYPGMTIACGHAGFTSALVELAGADIVEGVYGVYPTVGWDDDVPAMAKMTEYCQKYHPDDYGNMDYIISWAQSLITVEILRLAVENAGADNLTPQVVEAQGLKKLKNFDVGGLHGPVSYTSGDNRLSKSVRVFRIDDGVLEPITGWVESPFISYE